MALIRRTIAAALAGVALAATAVATPASAYWRASGGGSGNVTTSAAAAGLITLSLANANGRSIKATGTAGFTAPYNAAVTVVLCKVATWPCPAGSVAATLSTAAGSATPSYTASSGNLNGVKVWGIASQTQTSGWTDYSIVAGPITG